MLGSGIPYQIIFLQIKPKIHYPCDHMPPTPCPDQRQLQDGGCRELKDGDLVTAVLDDNDNVRYYDATLIKSQREEHGDGTRDQCFSQ